MQEKEIEKKNCIRDNILSRKAEHEMKPRGKKRDSMYSKIFLEYKRSTVEYKRSTSGVQRSTSGVRVEYSGVRVEYSEAQAKYK
jgi:hypothetical protein